MKIKHFIIFILSFIVSSFVSCSEERNGRGIYMIGDSIIKSWNLEDYTDLPVHNWGINGAGLDTIKGFSVDDHCAWVVCLVGTNDLQYSLTKEQRELYVEDYLSTVSRLGGRQIILFSVLPSSIYNRGIQILLFNEQIRSKVKDYSSIYYIDVYDYFLADDNKSIKKELSIDGLHLNDAGYQYLNKRLKEVIREL